MTTHTECPPPHISHLQAILRGSMRTPENFEKWHYSRKSLKMGTLRPNLPNPVNFVPFILKILACLMPHGLGLMKSLQCSDALHTHNRLSYDCLKATESCFASDRKL